MPRYLFLGLFGLLLAACVAPGPPRTCAEIGLVGLRDLMQQRLAPAEMQARIAALYGLHTDQVDASGGALSWLKKGDMSGEMRVVDSTPIYSTLSFSTRPPTANTVIQCFGPPDRYRAYYGRGGEVNLFLVELYYLNQGVLAAAYKYGGGREVPRLSSETPLPDFRFVPVYPPQQTLDYLMANQGQWQVELQMRPWPGKWEDVVVQVDPALQK